MPENQIKVRCAGYTFRNLKNNSDDGKMVDLDLLGDDGNSYRFTARGSARRQIIKDLLQKLGDVWARNDFLFLATPGEKGHDGEFLSVTDS